jgi:arylsulfatase
MIYADDLGYGDLSCYGSKIATPNLDGMARGGVRLTNFYSASAVCSPSRAALMTGRYPNRVGVPRVLGAEDSGGLDLSETTMADMLKSSGYATACVGKWHLGSKPEYMPTNRGFDEYFGIPYSHDMWPRPLMRNLTVIEQPAQLSTLTQRYTSYALDFINRSRNSPFFLYMPHSFPHIQLAVSPEFNGISGQGLYGDVVREIDWSVGQVLQSLKDNGLENNTLVVFSSDNGPWYQGSPGLLRGRKGDSYDGGWRVPCIARFPGQIPEGQVCDAVTTTMDILPTVARLTGASLPARPLDGLDIMPLLSGRASNMEREPFLYFNDVYLQCARLGAWKLHVARYNVPMFTPEPARGRRNLPLPRPELYNLVDDPEESYNRSTRNSPVVAQIQERVERLMETFPAEIRKAYEETRRRRVEDTPENAPPVEFAEATSN